MSELSRIDELDMQAKRSSTVEPAYGSYVDVRKYVGPTEASEKIDRMEDLPDGTLRQLNNIGIDSNEQSKAGTYVQFDNSVVYRKRLYPNLELLTLEEALQDEHFVQDYYWKLIDVGQDKFTASAKLFGKAGYVILTKPGQVVELPVQTCLFIRSPMSFQAPHNVVVAEEGSTVHVVTGCGIVPEAVGLHVGITEFYVKKGATVTFTMIHDWAPTTNVRPRTAAVVEDGGVFISSYINLSSNGLASIQMYPSVHLKGDRARAFLSSLVVGKASADIDLGSSVLMTGKESKAEIISKCISKDHSRIVARARIHARSSGSKGHIECRGLMLSDTSRITAVPELDSTASDVELTHEAAVGKLAEEEIFYLMSKGLRRDEAVSVLVRGFLEVKVPGLPSFLERQIKYAADQSVKGL
ncbi:MAG: SufD family Fe-S cluster assembly protein [Conexivisphaerales archaeon]|jgi:Fe-S cluster assembly scaffold protein SufB